MDGVRALIAGTLEEHYWWAAGNLGVPGMDDFITYKCNCGWCGDSPREHQADAIVKTLGLRK